MRRILLPVMLLALPGHAGAAQVGGAAAAATAATAARAIDPFDAHLRDASAGDVDAQRGVALAYRWGRGVPADQAEAVRWFRIAARQGDTASMTDLGAMYLNGVGVEQDDATAVEWFRQAALSGNARAQGQLAWCLELGRGVRQDEAAAVALHGEASAKGDSFARNRLILMLEDGRGSPAQPARAAALRAAMVAEGDVDGLGALGMLYQQRHQVERAQAGFQDALRLEQRGIGPELAIELFNRYASFCIENSQFGAAQSALERALALTEGLQRSNDARLIDMLDKLGYIHMAHNRYTPAIAMFERSLAIRRARGLDIVHPTMQLGWLAALEERFKDAEQYYRDARTYLYFAYPPGHEAFGRHDARLGALYVTQARYAEALPLLSNALRVQMTQPELDEAEIIDVLGPLGTTYYQLDRLDDAADTMARALAMAKQRYGPAHHRVATALNDLGVMEMLRQHLDAAEPLLRQGLAMRERLLGPGNADCAISLSALASLSTRQGKPLAAEQYLLRAISVNEAAMGKFHADVASNLNTLGLLYITQEQFTKAEAVLARAWLIRRDGPVSASARRTTATRLATVYRTLQRTADAAVLDQWLAANE